MDYSLATGDKFHDSRASNSLGYAAFNETGDILGGSRRVEQEKLFGKWNDDIAWWAISMATGAEVYGTKAVMNNSISFLAVAIKTWNQMLEPAQWDEGTCDGGIFWSRNRQSDKENERMYKSSITHTEFILLSGKLALLTGNRTYVDWASKVLTWMRTSGLILPNNHIIDGAYAPACTRKDIREFSYTSGTLVGGLAYLYEATKDSFWMTEADKFLTASLEQFTVDNILVETVCERTAKNCERDQKSFKVQLAKGLGYLYRFSNSDNMKRRIQTVIDASVTNMAATCDSEWNCPFSWLPSEMLYLEIIAVYSLTIYIYIDARLEKDVFNQHPSVDLLVAAAVVHPVKQVARPEFVAPDGTVKRPKNDGAALGMSLTLMTLALMLH